MPINPQPTPSDTFPFGQQIAWQPNPEWMAASNLQTFMDRHGIADYDALLARSTADIAWFWDAVLADLDIQFATPYSQVVDLSDGIQFPKWCVGGEMNIIHNCLDKYQADPATRDRIALRWEGEEGAVVNLTYGELHREVNQCANALRSLGLGKGDAVGLYMPMIPELAVAFLAIIKIGGVILPLFSGYGVSAVVTRLADADAKALFTVDGAFRRGKKVPMKPVADEAAAQVPSLQHMIVVDRVGLADTPWTEGRDIWWQDLVPGQSDEAETELTAAEDRAHDHLHQRHHRSAQGRGPHPLRLPGQGRPGHAPEHGSETRRGHVLDERHGLDDGAVAGLRGAAQRGVHGFLRRRARFPGRGPAVGTWWSATASPIWASRRR